MKSPEKWRPTANLSFHHFEGGRYAKALHYAEETIRMQPDHASGYLNAVSSLMALRPYETSYVYLKKALAIKPSKAIATNLIFVCRKLGRIEEINKLKQKIKEEFDGHL